MAKQTAQQLSIQTHTPLARKGTMRVESQPPGRPEALDRPVKTLRLRVIILGASRGAKALTVNHSWGWRGGSRGSEGRSCPGSKVTVFAQNLHLVDPVIHLHSRINTHY